MTTNIICKELFIKYFKGFSKEKPEELKILIVDKVAFHPTKDVELPKKYSIT